MILHLFTRFKIRFTELTAWAGIWFGGHEAVAWQCFHLKDGKQDGNLPLI
jgi:hypothetical protein